MSRNGAEEMSFLDHLEILRWHIIRSVIAIVIIACVAFVYRVELMDKVLLAPASDAFWTFGALCDFSIFLNGHFPDIIDAEALCMSKMEITMMNPKLQGRFYAAIMLSMISGVILAFPYIIYEIWKFIRPALYDKEQKSAKGVLFFGSILFFTGVLFGYFMIAPLAVHFLSTFEISQNLNDFFDMNTIMGTIASSTLACGVVFELPILSYYLTKAGLITPEFMKQYRKHAFVVTLILSAIITPPDVFSQILVAIPIMFLYEISIFISRMVIKKAS